MEELLLEEVCACVVFEGAREGEKAAVRGLEAAFDLVDIEIVSLKDVKKTRRHTCTKGQTS